MGRRHLFRRDIETAAEPHEDARDRVAFLKAGLEDRDVTTPRAATIKVPGNRMPQVGLAASSVVFKMPYRSIVVDPGSESNGNLSSSGLQTRPTTLTSMDDATRSDADGRTRGRVPGVGG